VVKQNRGDLLTTWMQEDKLDCSEELGDMMVGLDPRVASTIYQRVGAHEKVIRAFVDMGESHRIVPYCDATGYAPKVDFAAQIATFLQTNPPQAVSLAIGVLERTPPLLPVEKVHTPHTPHTPRVLTDCEMCGMQIIELFVQAQRLPDLTSVFQMALKHNKPGTTQPNCFCFFFCEFPFEPPPLALSRHSALTRQLRLRSFGTPPPPPTHRAKPRPDAIP
jgi:hypothetical protein